MLLFGRKGTVTNDFYKITEIISENIIPIISEELDIFNDGMSWSWCRMSITMLMDICFHKFDLKDQINWESDKSPVWCLDCVFCAIMMTLSYVFSKGHAKNFMLMRRNASNKKINCVYKTILWNRDFDLLVGCPIKHFWNKTRTAL